MEACKNVDVAVMVGGFPRKGGMERKDVMAKNVAIYKSQAAALEKGAKPDVKVTTIIHLSSTVMLQSYVQHACMHACIHIAHSCVETVSVSRAGINSPNSSLCVFLCVLTDNCTCMRCPSCSMCKIKQRICHVKMC